MCLRLITTHVFLLVSFATYCYCDTNPLLFTGPNSPTHNDQEDLGFLKSSFSDDHVDQNPPVNYLREQEVLNNFLPKKQTLVKRVSNFKEFENGQVGNEENHRQQSFRNDVLGKSNFYDIFFYLFLQTIPRPKLN